MEGACLCEPSISPGLEEDLALETAKTIAHRDTAKLRQLEVDLGFPEVAPSGLGVLHQVCTAETCGRLYSSTIR